MSEKTCVAPVNRGKLTVLHIGMANTSLYAEIHPGLFGRQQEAGGKLFGVSYWSL